jgi:hypothetical protein
MTRQVHQKLAASLRRAHDGRHSASSPLDDGGAIVIRMSRPDDRSALERLAALDSKTLPNGNAFLLAEIDGELAAALALDREGELVSDPFRPTANLRELLRLRASRMGANRGTRSPGRRRLRLALRTAA